MLEVIITLIVVAIILVAIFYIVSIWIYKRAPSNFTTSPGRRTHHSHGLPGHEGVPRQGRHRVTGVPRYHLGLARDDQIRG